MVPRPELARHGPKNQLSHNQRIHTYSGREMSKEHKSGSHLPEILQTAVLQTVKVDPLVPAFARHGTRNFYVGKMAGVPVVLTKSRSVLSFEYINQLTLTYYD